jgi:hypothetical protein
MIKFAIQLNVDESKGVKADPPEAVRAGAAPPQGAPFPKSKTADGRPARIQKRGKETEDK